MVEMTEGSDLDRFTTDLRTEIDAITDFPDQSEDPVVKQLGRTDFVASVALTGAAGKSDLKAYAEELKDRMLRFGAFPRSALRDFRSPDSYRTAGRDNPAIRHKHFRRGSRHPAPEPRSTIGQHSGQGSGCADPLCRRAQDAGRLSRCRGRCRCRRRPDSSW